MIRFIHAADLHLDTPFSGLEETSKALAEKLRAAPFDSLAKIVDLALAESVDFVLLAGDLYNTQLVNIKAQSLFIEQLKRLEKAEIAVFLIRGNHDYMTDEAKTLSLPLPKNVQTYAADVATHLFETKDKERVAVTGFSYDSQWVFERKIKDYPHRREDVDLHIGLLHGSMDGEQTKAGNYAPFSVNALRAKNYDYWALGHIHQYQQISNHPPAYYSGNIQGLHKNELGEKGCLLVEWTSRELDVQFVPTAPVIWATLTLDISEVTNVSQLFEKIQEEVAGEIQTTDKETLIHLTLRGTDGADEKIIRFVQRHEFSEQLTQQLKPENIWVVSTDFTLEEISDTQTLEKIYPEVWKQVLGETLDQNTFHEMTEEIFNQIPSKYLSNDQDLEYREAMIEKAIAKIHLK